jgi:hypothetical protein
MLRTLLKADVFRVLQDREATLTPASDKGGILSIVCVCLIVLGVGNESWMFFRKDWRSTMAVSKHALQMETVHFNVTFDNFPCGSVEFEAIEASTGRVYEEQQATLKMSRTRIVAGAARRRKGQLPPLSPNVEGQMGEGCEVAGTFEIDKVPGHFVIAARNLPGGNRPPTDFTINELWFGEKRLSIADIPEALANSLGGFRGEGEPPQTLYQFFVNIVPTSFEDGRLGFQYTSTLSHVQAEIPPGLYFHHVHSPLAVMYHKSRLTWTHYLTNLCAVVGGVFTVVGFGATAAHKAGKWFDRDRSNAE